MRPAWRVLAMRRPGCARGRACAHVKLDSGDGALVDALQANRCAQHYQILIERFNASRQPDAVDEVDFDALSFFARSVHEVVLRMRFCGRHGQVRLGKRMLAAILPMAGERALRKLRLL